MSRPFQVVVQTDLDIAPPSMDSVPEPFPDKVLMGQISAPLGLRSSSPAALDVGDIARKLYLMAFEAFKYGRFGQIGQATKPGFRNQPVAQRSAGLLIS